MRIFAQKRNHPQRAVPSIVAPRSASNVAEQAKRIPKLQLQRSCPCGGGCPTCHRQTEATDQDYSLQAKSARATDSGGDLAPAIVHEVLRSPGHPLATAIRADMESRFGYDFSDVRVHADARAAESSRAVGALAYTVGREVVFGAGQYEPETAVGRRLLAHELTHVVQQRKAGHAHPLQFGPADGAAEREADRSSERVTHGGFLAPLPERGPTHLQRKPDVAFTVHDLKRTPGRLDNPDQTTTPGSVSWPLSFAVDAPLTAEADVEVTGSPSDNCAAFELGFLQTVHSHSLQFDYLGQRPGHGTTIVKFTVDLPIRDGAPGSFWYEPSQNATPGSCGVRVKPGFGDYPTIFDLAKVRNNSKTGQDNFLAAVKRTIGFVTTLVASGPAGVEPLRFFLWTFQMATSFTPDPANPNDEWTFNWIENSVTLRDVHRGADATVPLFTTVTDTYNNSLTEDVTETT
jgi:hypothetical protein